MEHQWQLLGKDQGAYSVRHRYWCARCGTLKDSVENEDGYGLTTGDPLITFCAPGGNWSKESPSCKGQ